MVNTVPSGASPRLRKLGHPADKSIPVMMGDHVFPLSVERARPPVVELFAAAYIFRALSNRMPHVWTNPVLPTKVQDGAALGVGFGGGGLFDDELEPPPQATHKKRVEIARVSATACLMGIDRRLSRRADYYY